ncbi:MAG: L,D-transpeptidase family protein [Pseudomonadota bacterium]|nr:L,D-transpeptidase family protein [Pseudomonadota bacterium]
MSKSWRSYHCEAAALAALLCLGAAGCTGLRHRPMEPPLAASIEPAPAPRLPKPVAKHLFTIDANTEIVGEVQRTAVGKDDTLPDIARRFDVGYEEMLLANPGVDAWLPGVGREVVVPTQYVLPAAPHEGVVVNVAAMRIFYYPPHKKGAPQVVYTHPIGIGRVGWRTPEGVTKIVSRTKDPVWTVPNSVRNEHAENGDKLPPRVPAGPDNPLGQYMFRLSWPSYLIHGTNKPYGVGMRSSHGCMRLYPEDIAVFYDLIPIGTKVTVVNQPYMFGSRDGTLYLQAYAVMEDDSRDWGKNRKRLLGHLLGSKRRKDLLARDNGIDWQRVGDLARTPRAIPIPVSGGHDAIDALLAQTELVANTLPEGSNWDGKTGLLVDEKTFNDLVGGQSSAPPISQSQPSSSGQ